MAAALIGVDPAKRAHTIEVLDPSQTTLATARFDNNNDGYRPDGEAVLDVPSKLSTRARAIDTGHGPKNDPAVRVRSRRGGTAHPGAARGRAR